MISTLKEFRLVDKRTYIFAVILCVLYSISDEVHQYFVPGRSCELRDILIDISGCILAVLIIKLWRYCYAKRTTNNEKDNR